MRYETPFLYLRYDDCADRETNVDEKVAKRAGAEETRSNMKETP